MRLPRTLLQPQLLERGLEPPHQYLCAVPGAAVEESAVCLAWCLVCLQEHTERPFSTVLLSFASHMGPGLGKDVGL